MFARDINIGASPIARRVMECNSAEHPRMRNAGNSDIRLSICFAANQLPISLLCPRERADLKG